MAFQKEASANPNIYTLGYKGKAKSDIEDFEQIHTLYGTGTSQASMKKRPRKILMTQRLAIALVTVAENNNEPEMIQMYWNAYHCFNRIKMDGTAAFGKYCGTRICLACAANRKAEMINKYFPVVSQWKDTYFLTLTRKTVKRHQLPKTVNDCVAAFRRIIDRCNKRSKKGKGPVIKCIRSLECNYNPIDGKYNPHFHILVEGWEAKKTLWIEWLKEWGKGIASAAGQHARRIKEKELEKDLIEVIKYGAKIFTDPDMKKGKKHKADPVIYAAAIHEILKAFDGNNLLCTYGFSLPKQQKEKILRCAKDQDIKISNYDPKQLNYIEEQTGEVLYKEKFLPTPKVQYLVSERMDTESI